MRGVDTLGQDRLPQKLFPDQRLKAIPKEVQTMVKKQYSDYVLAVDHISHCRDMKLVSFAVDRAVHSLIVTFPVFIKDYQQPSLTMYEIEFVPIPIPDKSTKANSYSQIRIHKPNIAVGADYYMQLCMTELIMCKSLRYTYYCEELFVVKHKNKHSCASAISMTWVPRWSPKNFHFDYYFNKTVPLVIQVGGNKLLLANFHGPRSLQSNPKMVDWIWNMQVRSAS